MKLKLYVAGQSPNSLRALANIDAICEQYLDADGFELEVVDVLREPLRALEDQILVTPTLVKTTVPAVKIIGDLSERDRVLRALGLEGITG